MSMDSAPNSKPSPTKVIEAIRDLTERLRRENERRRKARSDPPPRTPPYGMRVTRRQTNTN